VIKHFYLRKWRAAQIKAELDEVHGDSAPALKTIWHLFLDECFKRGRISTQDEARSGRPFEVTTTDIVEKIHGIVMEDHRVKVREIAEAVSISTERVHHILHEKLHMKKLCARWVPRLLTLNHKRTRKDISMQCLEMFNRNPQDFLRRFVTVDETWIHHYTPETKQQ
jgi:histone-lysine N-methyltransferase SETMAR